MAEQNQRRRPHGNVQKMLMRGTFLRIDTDHIEFDLQTVT